MSVDYGNRCFALPMVTHSRDECVCRSCEWGHASQQLIKDDPCGENVGPAICRPAHKLFGRHVAGIRGLQFGYAKIRDAKDTAVSQQQVRGLNFEVHDAVFMGVIERR